MEKLLSVFAKNSVFATIALITILATGLIGVFSMTKESYPPMEMDRISISVQYPGADPEEIEEGISRKIEEAVEGLNGIKKYSTRSSEHYASATIEVVKGYDTQRVLDEVKSKINAISTFPTDAEKPVIKEIIRKSNVITIYMAADMPERRLKELGQSVTDRLKLLDNVSQVTLLGVRPYEISIEVSEEKLRQYRLTFDQVAKAVKNSSLNRPGGTIKTRGEEIRLRTMGRKYSGDELSNVVVLAKASGQIVTLDRIAKITDGFVEVPSRAHINGKRAVLISATKTDEENALVISDTIRKFVDALKKELPGNIEVGVLYDRSDMLKARINLLVKNGTFGLIIVFILLWVFLNTRLSIWVGMGIPISLAGAIAVLWVLGGTINMISLFGLIMVLGIVVDDAIVVGEAIYVHRKMGKKPLQAAIEGASEVIMPVIAAVATSIVAFLPLGFIGGTMGKFIAILPPIVISCLFISLLDCFFLLPAHLNHLPEIVTTKAKNKKLNFIKQINFFISHTMEQFVTRVYMPFLSRALRFRYVLLCVAVSLLLGIIGIVQGGLIKFTVFPETDGFVITSSVSFPEGTPASVTEAALKQIENGLYKYAKTVKTSSGEPLIKDVLSFVGATSDQMTAAGSHAGMIQAILIESEKRGIHSKDILFDWGEFIGPIPGVESLTFQAMGPGHSQAPLQFEMLSHNLDTLIAAIDKLKKKLTEYKGVYQIQSDFSQGKKELQLTLKPEARTLGLTVSSLASQINSAFSGNEALRLQRGEHDVRVKIRYTKNERSSFEKSENMRTRTPKGIEVPLLSAANITFQPGFSTIRRTNGMRSVMVSASVNTELTNTNEVFEALSKRFLKTLKDEYPGLVIILQGDKKRSRESFSSLQKGFPIALLGIFTIVATMFRSYLQPFIIMFTIPFGIIGAVLGHLVMGYNLSIMSVFGMVALTGVVVNDAIVLIERINENIAKKTPFFQAILKGGSRRFRAIFLTTISTVGGLAPMLLEADLQAKLLIPMAISLAAGVAFATLLTLFLIPCLLVILNDFRILAYRLIKGAWPESREVVEPAINRYQDDWSLNKTKDMEKTQ